MKLLVVLGTNHPLQCGHSSISASSRDAMATEICALVRQHGVKRIAEEMTIEGLKRHEVTQTIAATVADELSIEYEYVDLSNTDRSAISLTAQPAWATTQSREFTGDERVFRKALDMLANEVRERVWVHRILEGSSWPVLFICGSDHVIPITRLWQTLGLHQTIAHRDYAA